MSASRRKGTAFETAVVTFLREAGFAACERRALSGRADKGDIAGIPGWTLECKNEQRMTLASYVDDAFVEAVNAKTPWYAAVVKRRGRGTSHSYVVMPLSVFAEIAKKMSMQHHG